MAYKYPTSIRNGVRCWICVHRHWIVAKKGDDTDAGVWANRYHIVFPFDDGLIGYSQQCGDFHLTQAPVDARQTKVLAEGLRGLRSPLPNPPIDRNRWEMCDNCPTTNTQQGARHLLPPPPFPRRAGAAPAAPVAELGVVRRLSSRPQNERTFYIRITTPAFHRWAAAATRCGRYRYSYSPAFQCSIVAWFGVSALRSHHHPDNYSCGLDSLGSFTLLRSPTRSSFFVHSAISCSRPSPSFRHPDSRPPHR